MTTMTQLTRTQLTLLLVASLCALSPCVACAGGDPFYYSTWYGQPTSATTWAGASVMGNHPYQAGYSLSGPLYPHSPKYFQPGYGYIAPAWPFRSTLRFYDQHYSFGAFRETSPPNYAINPMATSGFGSAFGVTGDGQIGGLAPVGTLHAPWYFPGSPGNEREFLFAW